MVFSTIWKLISKVFGSRKSDQPKVNPDFQCTICLDILVGPVYTNCQHYFCDYCLTEAQLTRTRCPLCNECIKHKERDFEMEAVIRSQLWESKESKLQWLKRWKAYVAWDAKRKLVSYRQGDIIDAQDSQGVWCPAEIKMVMNLGTPILYVHFKGEHAKFDEFINASSIRLAPRGFFTSRRGILKLEPRQEDEEE